MRALSPLLSLLALLGCARGNDIPHGDGGPRVDAAMDAFVAPGVDAFRPGVDAFVPGNDAYVAPGVDAYVPPVDAYVPPTDAFHAGTGAYFDPCTSGANCASGSCTRDRGTASFCTHSCTSDADCAWGHLCQNNGGPRVCVPDDIGAPCSTTTPATCAVGACLGSPSGAHCTHFCTSAADCAAGYACSHLAGDTVNFVCINIEQTCLHGADCPGGYCTTFGCSAPCRSPSDCPARIAGLPAYACNTSLGSADPICIPPSDVMGGDPIGAICPATGTNTCRSGACDTDTTPPMCTDACTEHGGCAAGLGCTPTANGTDIILVCERAGTLGLGAVCAHGSECASGLCDGSGAVGHCTRLCDDGRGCPTGFSCQTLPGFAISLCRP